MTIAGREVAGSMREKMMMREKKVDVIVDLRLRFRGGGGGNHRLLEKCAKIEDGSRLNDSLLRRKVPKPKVVFFTPSISFH